MRRRPPRRHAGLVAAGHPLTARVAADVLADGGGAVDAAVAGVLTSWACEPLLTGPAAGGHLLVAGARDADGRPEAPVALDAFCVAPGKGLPADRPLTELAEVDVDFGDAHQTFHAGAASVGGFGLPAGLLHAHARWGRLPLDRLTSPAAAIARGGVLLNGQQATVAAILRGILLLTPGSRAVWAPDGELLGEGDRYRSPGLAETIERLATDGAAPLREGDLAAACVDWTASHGGRLTAADLAGHEPTERDPVRVAYRGREVLTTPPPSAGGLLLALALGRLAGRADDPEPAGRDAGDLRLAGGPSVAELVAAMADAEDERTPAFVDGLVDPAFAQRALRRRLGGTTHLSVIDSDGAACGVTTTNGEGSGLVVPGTGIHLNNVMGEADLNPLGPTGFPPGRRLPSMMTPTAVLAPDGTVEAILGSAGSERIRSALLQVLVGMLHRGRTPREAVEAPRLHIEHGTIHLEPGVDEDAARASGRPVVAFAAPSLYFGGVQVVRRDPTTGVLSAAGDPRRGGAVAAPR